LGGSEGGVTGTSGVLVVQGIAIIIPHKGIEIPIPVDVGEGGDGKIYHIRQSEGVGSGGTKAGVTGTSGVPVVQGIAITIPHKGIEIPILVDVGEGGDGKIYHIRQSEGVGLGGSEGGVKGISSVPVVQGFAITLPHKGIEISIPVDVGEGGGGRKSHIRQSEGVGGGGSKARCCHDISPNKWVGCVEVRNAPFWG